MFLTLSGNWQNASEIILALLQGGYRLEYQPLPAPSRFPLLVALTSFQDLPDGELRGWLAWQRVNDASLTLSAYQRGARVVFPPEMPPSLLAQSLRQMILPAPEKAASVRSIRRGDPVFLENGSVLTVREGVLATMMAHNDGGSVLLGLTGPGQIIVAHPDDDCFIQVVAHTRAVISVEDWDQAAARPDFPEKLRARLQRMEAWAAMQARPYLEQRILGILSLLAEEFGKPHPQGTRIELRLTHAQLASAVGATRTTITRVLRELRELGKLQLEGSGREERFILRQPDALCHQ